jgi:hypothetical protein
MFLDKNPNVNTGLANENIVIENIAISDEPTSEFILYYEEDSNYELSSFSKQHILDHGCPEYKSRVGKEAL